MVHQDPLQVAYLLEWLTPTKLAPILVAVVLIKLLSFLFQRVQLHKTFTRMQIPGPKPNLIHGHLYETRREAYVKYAHRLHKIYGNNVGIYLGGDPYLITKDLDLIQQVFVGRTRIFYNRMNFYLNVDPVPDNLICQRGDRWRYMRKLLTPAFNASKIKSSQFHLDAHKTVEKFVKQIDENSVDRITLVSDTYDRMAAVALDVIVKTAFHMDDVISFDSKLNTTRSAKGEPEIASAAAPDKVVSKSNLRYYKKDDQFLTTVKMACKLGFNPLIELIFCFPFLDRPLTYLCSHVYFGNIIRLLFDRLDYLVRRPVCSSEQELKKPQSIQPASTSSTHQRRIIDSLIEVLRERKITRSEFTGNAFVIVFAGFETTANALTFTLWLLSRNQRVQRKLREHLRHKLASVRASVAEGEEKLLAAELHELANGCDYLEMVINESLRMYPPVPGLSCRQASQSCTLANGMKIERGVNVVPSVFSIHRDKSIWGEDAAKFRPERFEMLDTNQLNSAMFMPFGLGPRNCIGKAAALNELKIVVGRLVSKYSIESQPGITPERLKLCSPVNITLTNSEQIGLKFVKIDN